MSDDKRELLTLLAEMVFQHCAESKGGVLDTCCLSVNKDAMLALVRAGVMVEVNKGYGRAYLARFVVSDDPVKSVAKALEDRHA